MERSTAKTRWRSDRETVAATVGISSPALMKPTIGSHTSGMNQLVEFALIHTKLTCPLSKCGAIEPGYKAPWILCTCLQPDQFAQGLFQRLTIDGHCHTSL